MVNNNDSKNTIETSKNVESETNQEPIKEIANPKESQQSQNINLDNIWEKVIAMLELPSTKMLLSQQAKLITLNADSAEIAISGKWMTMIQSRKKLIEDAFSKARGMPTKISLVQQKDNFSNQKEEREVSKKTRDENILKVNSQLNQNHSKDPQKIEIENNSDAQSIDKKAKQFADFFNGEVVNLE